MPINATSVRVRITTPRWLTKKGAITTAIIIAIIEPLASGPPPLPARPMPAAAAMPKSSAHAASR